MKETSCDTASCLLCKSCLPQWSELTRLKKKTLQFKKGALLFREGDTVTGIYFTLSGIVKVHRRWGGDGKERIIRFAGGGDIIGIRGLGGKDIFPVSATALEPTTSCFIPNEHLHASLLANPVFSYNLMQFYAAELMKAEARISDLAHSDVKGRLAAALLELQQAFGLDAEGFICLAISRQDLAAYAGTSYETIFKIFTEWQSAGIISTDGRRIKVHELAKLEAFQ